MSKAYALYMYLLEGQPLSEILKDDLIDYLVGVMWTSICEDVMHFDIYLSDGVIIRSE